MVPRIILSMGASHVEAVTDVKDASKKPYKWDYVVVKDGSEMKTVDADDACEATVSFNWVKECLIAGRVLPVRR